MSSEPVTRKNVAEVWFATACAKKKATWRETKDEKTNGRKRAALPRIGIARKHLGQQRLARSRLSIQDDSLRGPYANVLVQLGVCERQLDSLLHLLRYEVSVMKLALQAHPPYPHK